MLFPLANHVAIRGNAILVNTIKRANTDFHYINAPELLVAYRNLWPADGKRTVLNYNHLYRVLPNTKDAPSFTAIFRDLLIFNNARYVLKAHNGWLTEGRKPAEVTLIKEDIKKLIDIMAGHYWSISDDRISANVANEADQIVKLTLFKNHDLYGGNEAVVVDKLAAFSEKNDMDCAAGMLAILENTKSFKESLAAFNKMGLFIGEKWRTISSWVTGESEEIQKAIYDMQKSVYHMVKFSVEELRTDTTEVYFFDMPADKIARLVSHYEDEDEVITTDASSLKKKGAKQ